jgi:hypothetical protein
VPTEPDALTPIIATETLFVTLLIFDVAATPVTDWNVNTSPVIVPTDRVEALPLRANEVFPRDTVPADRVAALPDTSTDLDGATVPTDKVAEFPVTALELDAVTDPADKVAALPVMATVLDVVTVPTLPVAMTPSSCSDMLTSKVPTAPVAWFPLTTTLPMPYTPLP